MSNPERSRKEIYPTLTRVRPEETPASLLYAVLNTFHAGAPDVSAVRHLVTLSHRFAVAYLSMKAGAAHLSVRSFGLSMDDLALDVMAGLFQRDAQGRYTKISDYLEAVGWPAVSANAQKTRLEGLVRRMVCRAVDDGLAALYLQHDPSLSRLIRNLRRAAALSEDMQVIAGAGRKWVVFARSDHPPFSPLLSQDRLEAALIAAGAVAPADVVDRAREVVLGTPDVAPVYPLSGLALAARRAAVHLQSPPPDVTQPANMLEREDLLQLARRVVDRECRANRRTYVGRGKVDADTFAAYYAAIGDALLHKIGLRDGSPSLYACLADHLPYLTRETYRSDHRTRLEYLFRLTRDRFADQARRNMDVG